MNGPEKEYLWSLCREAAALIGPRWQFDANADLERRVIYIRSCAELLFGTAATESGFRYRRQTTPAALSTVGGFGIWQVELRTAENLLLDLLKRPTLSNIVAKFIWPHDQYPPRWFMHTAMTAYNYDERAVEWLLRGSDRAGVCLARLKYLSIPSAIPCHESLLARRKFHAEYWKQWYNTEKGRGTVEKYVQQFDLLCLPILEG